MSHTMMLVPKRASFRERVSRALEAVRSYTLTGLLSSDKKTAEILGFGSKTDAGIVVTARNAFTFSAVFDAVNQGSSDVAKLPLNLLKWKQGGGTEHFIASRTYRLLKDEPNPEMSAMDFRQTLQAHAMTLHGAFAEIERDGAGRPFWLWPITPDRVERKRDGTGPLYYLIDGKDPIPARDMLDIRGLGYDGNCAYDVIDKARQAIGLALAAEKFGATFFGSGAGFPGLLGIKSAVGPDGMQKLREHVDAQYGQGSWNRFLVIDNDPSFTSFGTDPQKAQMNELRSKQVEEVARFFNFPVHKLKNLDRATNNNIEQQDLEYYKGFQLNWITKWEQECNRKLIPPLERQQQFFKHNVNAFMRGDTASRTALYTALLDRGVINADEVRELEDMNPQPNGLGKMFLVQGAMVPKDKIEKIAEKAAAPTPAPIAPKPDDDAGVTQDDVDQANDRAVKAEQLAEEMRTTAQSSQRRVAELEGAAGASADAIAAAQALATTEQQRANTAELLASECRRTADTLQVQFAEAQAERDRLAAEVEATRTAAAEERDRLAADVTAATQLASEAQTAAQTHERVATERAGTIEQLEAARTAAESQTTSARQDVARLTSELEAARASVAEVEAAHQAAVDAHAAALSEREAAAASLERDLQTAREQGSARADDVTRLSAELAAIQATVSTTVDAHAAALSEREAAITAAEARASDAQANLTTASARLADIERALEAERSSRRSQVGAEIAAHRGLVVDIMRRMVERETDRARRNQATAEKLRQWLDTFYSGHEDLMRTALLPAVRIHLAWIGSTDDPVDVAARLAARHVEESTRQVRVVLEGDAEDLATSLPGLLHRWETTRVSTIADALMQKELDHVRER